MFSHVCLWDTRTCTHTYTSDWLLSKSVGFHLFFISCFFKLSFSKKKKKPWVLILSQSYLILFTKHYLTCCWMSRSVPSAGEERTTHSVLSWRSQVSRQRSHPSNQDGGDICETASEWDMDLGVVRAELCWIVVSNTFLLGQPQKYWFPRKGMGPRHFFKSSPRGFCGPPGLRTTGPSSGRRLWRR